MARLNTTTLKLTVSKLQRNTEEDEVLLSDDTITQLIEVIEQLSASNVIVELELV